MFSFFGANKLVFQFENQNEKKQNKFQIRSFMLVIGFESDSVFLTFCWLTIMHIQFLSLAF